MNELVWLKNDDVFTDSKVIADGTNNEHHAIQQIIKKYQKDIEDFGVVRFTHFKCENSKGGRPEKIYLLNEEQATFVITLLKNSPKVVAFKKELVKQFYSMRKVLLEKQTEMWIETRQKGKLVRKSEVGVIKQLVDYAKSQGSTHADMLYMTYSKLANKYAGISKRDTATVIQLNQLLIYETIAENLIKEGMKQGMNYKQIYQITKERFEMVQNIAYLKQAN